MQSAIIKVGNQFINLAQTSALRILPGGMCMVFFPSGTSYKFSGEDAEKILQAAESLKINLKIENEQ